MKDRSRVRIKLTEDGCLRLSEYLAEEYGLLAGADVVLEKGTNELRILRSVSHLARVYVEPTTSCGLRCRTCVRNVWEETAGFMSEAVFEKLAADLEAIKSKPSGRVMGIHRRVPSGGLCWHPSGR
jgi:hypothetical protein